MILFVIGFVLLIGTLVFMKFGKRVAEENHWVKPLCLMLLLAGLICWVNGLVNMLD